MAHIAKIMARLGPKTPTLIGAGGSVEDLTQQDIAAALALVPRGLGRELVCHVWWPDAGPSTADNLDHLLMEAQLGEWQRRADVMVTAQIQEAFATMPRKGGLGGDDAASSARRASSLVAAAKAQMWPRICGTYQAIREAVLSELASGDLCRTCQGNRQVRTHGRMAICRACEGTGHRRISDRQRSLAIGNRHESDYRRHWRPVYEWTLVLCTDALADGTAALKRAVGEI